MPISELQRNTPSFATGTELSKWMEQNGVRVDRARIPEWLAKEKAADEAKKKGNATNDGNASGCYNRKIRGCPDPLPPYDKDRAAALKAEGWRLKR